MESRVELRCLRFASAAFALAVSAWAQSGVVRSGGQPIPGAAVTAVQDGKTLKTVTGADGRYAFAGIAPGGWTITVTMFGFAPQHHNVAVPSASREWNFDLRLAESEAMKRIAAFTQRAASPNANSLDTQIQSAMTSEETAAAPTVAAPAANGNEAFLVGGSLSPGLQANATPDAGLGPPGGPFGPGMGMEAGAQGAANAPGFGGPAGGPGGGGPGGFGGPGGGPGGFGGGRGGFGGGGRFGGPRGGGPPGGRRQFGNRRRPTQIHGLVFATLQNSALNAKPFSFTGQDIAQPAYAQTRYGFVLGGPLTIPKIVNDSKTFFFVSYFGTRARGPVAYVETVPTAAERAGNFSATLESAGAAQGLPVEIYDPTTHTPLPGNVIPASRLSSIAQGLLGYIPLPNQPGVVNNYELQGAAANNTDNFNGRVQRNITAKDRLAYHINYQHRDGTAIQPFAYTDPMLGMGFRNDLTWTRTISTRLINNAMVTFNRNTNQTTPFFANGANVAADLGIAGTSTNPLNYGPPGLNFTNFGALGDANPLLTRNQSQGGSDSVIYSSGPHTVTLGVQFTRNDLNYLTDINGRGTMNFTGFATSAFTAGGNAIPGTGFDFADFLFGAPESASIRYGDTATYFREDVWSGFAMDDWKVNANLTLDLGLRYEYFSPYSEKYNRIVNLDIAPGFTAVAPVTPGATGPYTGAFPSGLINPDYNNFGPRVGLAWKTPWGKQSTIIRAGYGIYYNGQAYIPFATQLNQQPPFAVSANASSTLADPLTIATGFLPVTEGKVTNTYAVDKNFRTPYAQTWNFTIQKELPKGFFVDLGYVGTKGTDLGVQTVPNQGPSIAASERLVLGNALGYTYNQSVGDSSFNALHIRATQRFRRGFSFSAYYQYAKSIDDSSTFGGAGNTVAQNWLDLAAERGLSSFDQRHTLYLNGVATSPVGLDGSRFAPHGFAARLLGGWQLGASVTAASGLPLTARVLGNTAQLAQTGGVGSGRAEATGESIYSSTGFFNLGAFTIPPANEFGNAARNTIPGPNTFAVNLDFGRSFQFGESRRRLELRLQANNVFNQVSFTNLYTVVNATNYGLPSAAASMRTVVAVFRFRF